MLVQYFRKQKCLPEVGGYNTCTSVAITKTKP